MPSIAMIASLLAILANHASATASLFLAVYGLGNVRGGDNLSVVTTVTNTGDETLKLYKDPRSVLSPFPENTFSIYSETGASPDFVGARAKYAFNAATNFVTLEPGANVSVTHDLGSGYSFTQEGEYKVETTNLLFYQDEAGNPQPIHAVVSSTHQTKLSGSLQSSKRRERGMGKRATFAGCTASQQADINSALGVSTTYIANAVNYLTSLTGGKPRYTTWFGTYSSTRKATVLDHFEKIQSSDPRTYQYDCQCTDDSYAWVYPNEFGIVHLCNAFWPAGISGTDSKAGTIIHEASHFTRNGGTDDIRYGQSGCKQLALENPNDAIRNADSHEYLAENTPTLS
ncbi:hypothetical protein M408DRAFT_24421 [Serendipita vermifera MAFF 305830]|uniref:Lysine-specific metallo-endopeptidase domain-containing protein n=1 Tax=Serendipita vermifera MAFF 305830 TaxID=933852 RepID=A0A0C3B5L4_SERVB|nr:hypothetical protein M408DRAFT_24421 [Serendipita vermifera MAFF 305830]